MANVPDDLRYTTDHEWARRGADGVIEIGVTDYAQGELGDVVFVNLPKSGEKYPAHGVFGTIEAVKAVSDLFCPMAGNVVESNAALDADPAAVNRSPYGDGWMIRLKPDDAGAFDALMDAAGYRAHIGA